MFGHEKGAFTGAQARKKGRFELADGGTLFLDEIGDLSPATQVKLLRVLQEREFERLGGTETVKVNVRLIAATHRDVEQMIAEGTFREDLHYRLNVFTIFVPPLRERKADLLLLADHYLEKLSRAHGKHIRRISTPAIDMLTSYHWPGNVRELVNCLERAVLVCDGDTIHAHHLPPTLQTAEASEDRGERLAAGRGRGVREGPDPGRPEERTRQSRPCRPPPADHATDPELPGEALRNRLAAVQALIGAHSAVPRRVPRESSRRGRNVPISSGQYARPTPNWPTTLVPSPRFRAFGFSPRVSRLTPPRRVHDP